MNHLKFFTGCFLVFLLALSSCNNSDKDEQYTQGLTTDSTEDATVIHPKSEENDSFPFEKFDSVFKARQYLAQSPMEKEKIKRSIKLQEENLKNKRRYGPNFNSGSEIQIISSEILFTKEYQPYLSARIKNNLIVSFIGIEIIVSSNCKTIPFKKNLTIKPNQTIDLHQSLDPQEDTCYLAHSDVSLGNCIMYDGKMIEMDKTSAFFREIQNDK